MPFYYSSALLGCILLAGLFLSGCNSDDEQPFFVPQPPCTETHTQDSLSIHQLYPELHAKMDTTTGVYVLEEGKQAMLSRAWLTDHAQETIDIQYFIFSADNVGTIACDYLLRAAKRGVRVRIIIDDVVLHVESDFLLALEQHDNVEIKIYNPNINTGKKLGNKILNVITDFHGINQRMHNKTFIVDGRYVITGGRNIADEYFDYDHAYNFRDRDVLLLGGVSSEVQKSFEEYWQDDLSVTVSDLISFSDSEYDYTAVHNYVRDYACNPDNFWPQIREEIDNLPKYFDAILHSDRVQWVTDIEFISDIPGKNAADTFLGGGGKTTSALLELLEKAEKEIYIQSPYLVTSEPARAAFKKVVDRGVTVHILTNSLSCTDNLEAFSGYVRDRKELLETGVQIYEFRADAEIRKQLLQSALQKNLGYQPTFAIHAKSMVIDDKTTVIGTFNLDPRSAHLNTECITIINSSAITSQVKAGMIAEQLPENAWRTTPDYNPDKEAGLSKRMKVKLRRLIPSSIL